MHLARPKSSKGRSRSAVNNSLCSGDGGRIQRPVLSPDSLEFSRPDRNLSSHSQVSQLRRDGALEMLQQAPPPQSLNRYTVLPSIGRRQSEPEVRGLGKKMSKLSLSNDAILQQRHRHEEPDLPTVKDVTPTSGSEVDWKRPGVWPEPPDTGQVMTEGAAGLLLAIRAPCGRRFQQHFDPTDTLLTVRGSAELRYEAQYGEASIETMDVPRRTFTDMDLTLAQCGILNRSVLCISQNDGAAEH